MTASRFTVGMLLLGGLLGGCVDFGKVEQGRAVAFDEEKRVCTIIRDVSPDPQKPDYTGLPPVTFGLPEQRSEMGAAPAVGMLLKVDLSSRQLVTWDDAAQSLRTVSFEPVSVTESVDARDPLVFDRAEKAARKFPVIDREKGTLTLYLKAERRLLTVALPPDALALPDRTWELGDEVRIYFKDAQTAERFMNVSKTDIFSK